MEIKRTYRIKMYRKKSGPSEWLVIATSKAKAETKAKLREGQSHPPVRGKNAVVRLETQIVGRVR